MPIYQHGVHPVPVIKIRRGISTDLDLDGTKTFAGIAPVMGTYRFFRRLCEIYKEMFLERAASIWKTVRK